MKLIEFVGSRGPGKFRVNPLHVVSLEQKDKISAGKPVVQTLITCVNGKEYLTYTSMEDIEKKLEEEMSKPK